MLKTFFEVLATIKEGETYISIKEGNRLKEIRYNPHKNIEFIGTVETLITPTFFSIDPHNKIFELKRKEYSFYGAYTAYKEGKIIESLESKCCYKKEGEIKKEWSVMNPEKKYDSTSFSINEIEGKWYIYDQEEEVE